MAHAIARPAAHHAARPFGASARFAEFRARLNAALERRRSYHQTVVELEQLTDRELADLGIHRHDIRRTAREAADRAVL